MLRKLNPTKLNSYQLICVRYLTATEVSTALRPFYFAVHPDLFGQYPTERSTNENSLQQLSAILNNLQASKPIQPTNLQFYIKNRNKAQTEVTSLRLIKIQLNQLDIRSTVLTILRSCQLPTDYVDKIAPSPFEKNRRTVKLNVNDVDLTNINKNHPIYAQTIFQRDIEKAKEKLKLNNWLKTNYEEAIKLTQENKAVADEVNKIRNNITEKLKLKEIKFDCGWNDRHFRGCLMSFQSLSEQHPAEMHNLEGRTLIFSNFTGVSLDGNITLYTGEVRNNWLDLIKNIPKYDLSLYRLPVFEKSLSHVLRNIKVGRRKFMPKIASGEYEKHLNQITTSLCDFRSRKKFPIEWPDSLDLYEIVVETESGPLMVSPTGQFIVPCSLPGNLLVNFITTNLKEAHDKQINYQRDKHIERSLHAQVVKELQLYRLLKDDNVTPDLMIKCCERMLENKQHLAPVLKDVNLNIATYYSVLSDGVVCIPWNWKN